MPKTNLTVEQRFWMKVDKRSNPDGCWEWTGGKVARGRYGGFKWNGVMASAHRVSMIFAGHKLAPSDFICHKCDNTICVNPDHLYVGTPATNSRDMVDRGSIVRGVDKFNARLTPAIVVKIRALVAGGANQRELGEFYGVHQTTISSIARRRVWKWVPEEI